MNKILLYIAFILFFTACKKNDSKNIVIDLSKNEKVSFHEVFSNVDVLPLQTDSLFSVKRIQKTIYKNHHYYILDKELKTLFIFNEDGSFKSKIHKVGKRHGEYETISDFEINPYTNNIELLTKRDILIYDTLLNLKDSLVFASKKFPFAHNFKLLTPDTTIFFSYGLPHKVGYYARSKKKIVGKYYERPDFIAKMTPFNTPLSPFYQYDSDLNMFDASSNKVYSITSNGFDVKYNWDFGKYTFDAAQDLIKQESAEYYKSFRNKTEKAFCFWYNIENKKFIITSFQLGKQTMFLIYNKESRKYKAFPSFLEGGGIPFYPFFVNDELIVIVKTGKENIPKVALDEKSRNILKGVNTTDNPVILKFHFNEAFLK